MIKNRNRKKPKYASVKGMQSDYLWANILRTRLNDDFMELSVLCEHRSAKGVCGLRTEAKKNRCKKMGACPLLQREVPKHTSKGKLRALVPRMLEPEVPDYLKKVRAYNGHVIYKDRSNTDFVALDYDGKEVATGPVLKVLLLDVDSVQDTKLEVARRNAYDDETTLGSSA